MREKSYFRSWIYKNHLGDPQDLKRVIFRGKAGCGHPVTATLQDVLKQPDFVNPDHETEHPNASVFCLYTLIAHTN